MGSTEKISTREDSSGIYKNPDCITESWARTLRRPHSSLCRMVALQVLRKSCLLVAGNSDWSFAEANVSQEAMKVGRHNLAVTPQGTMPFPWAKQASFFSSTRSWKERALQGQLWLVWSRGDPGAWQPLASSSNCTTQVLGVEPSLPQNLGTDLFRPGLSLPELTPLPPT